MTYCNHIWGTAPLSSLDKIVVLQKGRLKLFVMLIKGHQRTFYSENIESSLSFMSMFIWYLDLCSDISIDPYLLCLLVTSKPMLIFTVMILDKPFISISWMLNATLVKNIRYRGAQIKNHLLELGIDSETFELVFTNCVKCYIRNGMLTALRIIG